MTMKTCARCSAALDLSAFGRDKSRGDGLNVYCRTCARERSAAYAAANPERVRAIKAAYDARNTEKAATWKAENAEYLKSYWRAHGRAYRQRHKAETAAKTRRQQAARRRAIPPWFDKAAEVAVYAEAQRRRAAGEEVDVDHIFPIAGKTVSGLHWHGNLRIVPSGPNRSRGNRLDPSAAPLASMDDGAP